MKAKAAPQFHQCHLKILRSLYTTCDENDSAIDEGSPIGGNSAHQDKYQENIHDEDPVTDKIWSLIQQFIHQRSEYRPRKERQTHWTQLHSESQSRLNHLLSLEQEKPLKKATPSRTPLLGMVKKYTGTSLLTPLSSNKTDVQVANQHEISCWTFINGMVQKRARLCTASCDEFRSQSCLGELYNECNLRVKLLNDKLEQLKRQDDVVGSLTSGHETKKGVSDEMEPITKRSKIDSESSYYFFRDYHSVDLHSLETSQLKVTNLDESIKEIQIKLCLWSNLLASMKEIVGEP